MALAVRAKRGYKKCDDLSSTEILDTLYCDGDIAGINMKDPSASGAFWGAVFDYAIYMYIWYWVREDFSMTYSLATGGCTDAEGWPVLCPEDASEEVDAESEPVEETEEADETVPEDDSLF